MAKHKKNNIFTAILAILPMWIMAIIACLFFTECGSDNAKMPRKKAFPRIETHDSTFVPLTSSPIYFEINTATKLTLDSINTGKKTGENSRWFNFEYPQYKAVIYCTFTPVNKATLNSVIDNRTHRMKLNSGNLTSELSELTNANGFKSQILTTIENRVTPIQFISTDAKNWVVSGAVYFNDNDSAKIDSIKPIVSAIRRDIIHSLKTIGK